MIGFFRWLLYASQAKQDEIYKIWNEKWFITRRNIDVKGSVNQ